MSNTKPLKMDSRGEEALKPAIIALLNNYPGLNDRVITFQGLKEDGGISMELESGALVYSEQPDIIGNVYQECQFPFFVVYRSGATNEYQKMKINEFLDTLGAWLSREEVTIDNQPFILDGYPLLAGNRTITGIVRFNSYALTPNENKTQDWVLPVTVNYTHIFKK